MSLVPASTATTHAAVVGERDGALGAEAGAGAQPAGAVGRDRRKGTVRSAIEPPTAFPVGELVCV